ncbi:AAA family ATPase [Herbiconiux daphne]|uniref:AAA family ATPase n=1 Tax=Herbiconiux daphne TaxID=2970914 RepID=A0ABT2H6Y1_9MICO|nr:AAA family ATPase [Herbiconiux daphne]MCS5735664.1 AAA family ATPase [Herbiconiux daphne]
MRLHSVYARFYRSLNYDFIRASGENYEPDPWDATTEGDYPFVRIKLRPGITTIVGANESGKSQVLSAIEAALTGEGFERSDFCRYSRFFGIHDHIVLPEFGVVFADLLDTDVKLIESMSGHRDLRDVERVAFFRMNDTPIFRVYVRQKGVWTDGVHVQKPSMLSELGMPVPFRINAEVPLPESVPLDYLVSVAKTAPLGRDRLRELWAGFQKNNGWFQSDQTITANAAAISQLFRPVREATSTEIAMYELAADLIFKVAGVKRELIRELQEHVKKKNGYANSIVDTINSELAKALDFPHWWSQDSQFELFVSLFEFDLVFMIHDRTGRTYGFDERSAGLKYFLSYFVQYLAHEVRSDGRPEILLMDEPDQFLSASGQQDLLRVFDDFADPKDAGRSPIQVVYVTHSPFLIDKNEADRIRVLEKGEYDEGTRVVTSTAANHYEPLRSAFGSFVAETTFIGNCNLMVEGPSDQVLIRRIPVA